MESTEFSPVEVGLAGRPLRENQDEAEPNDSLAGLHFFKGDTPESCGIANAETSAGKATALKRCAEVIRGAHAALDLEYAQAVDHLARTGRPSPCGVGCSACCKQAILSNPFEAVLIAKHLAQASERADVFLENYGRWDVRTRALRSVFPGWTARMVLQGDDDGSFAHGAFTEPCPFLVQERCLAYAVRPYGCRSYLALSDACRNPTEAGQIAGRQGVGVGMASGFHQKRQQLLGMLWGLLGIDAARTRGHFLPDLVKLALEEDLDALLARCVIVATPR